MDPGTTTFTLLNGFEVGVDTIAIDNAGFATVTAMLAATMVWDAQDYELRFDADSDMVIDHVLRVNLAPADVFDANDIILI